MELLKKLKNQPGKKSLIMIIEEEVGMIFGWILLNFDQEKRSVDILKYCYNESAREFIEDATFRENIDVHFDMLREQVLIEHQQETKFLSPNYKLKQIVIF